MLDKVIRLEGPLTGYGEKREDPGDNFEFYRSMEKKCIENKESYLDESFEAGFDAVCKYVSGLKDKPYGGLFLVFGDFKEDMFFNRNEEITEKDIMEKQKSMQEDDGKYLMKFRWTKDDIGRKYQIIEDEEGSPLLYLPDMFDFLSEISQHNGNINRDGAAAFNVYGRIKGNGITVNNGGYAPFSTINSVMDFREIEGDPGTKHPTAITASNKGLRTIAASRRARTVIGFKDGEIAMSYDSRKPEIIKISDEEAAALAN